MICAMKSGLLFRNRIKLPETSGFQTVETRYTTIDALFLACARSWLPLRFNWPPTHRTERVFLAVSGAEMAQQLLPDHRFGF